MLINLSILVYAFTLTYIYILLHIIFMRNILILMQYVLYLFSTCNYRRVSNILTAEFWYEFVLVDVFCLVALLRSVSSRLRLLQHADFLSRRTDSIERIEDLFEDSALDWFVAPQRRRYTSLKISVGKFGYVNDNAIILYKPYNVSAVGHFVSTNAFFYLVTCLHYYYLLADWLTDLPTYMLYLQMLAQMEQDELPSLRKIDAMWSTTRSCLGLAQETNALQIMVT